MRFLVPIDGSEACLNTIAYVVQHSARLKEVPEIHLLTVQRPLSGDVSRFISQDELRDYHREEGEKRLAEACTRLDAGQVACTKHISVGNPAEIIVRFANDLAVDQIVMATRGMGNVGGMLLGSVATRVVQLSQVPVLLVK